MEPISGNSFRTDLDETGGWETAERLLILGAGGQLGRGLARAAGSSATLADRTRCDISNRESVRRVIGESLADVVINSAGYTDVNRAETERAECDRLNVHAVGLLAEECQRAGTRLVHVSTDYVFGADEFRGSPYVEGDPTGPLGYYAASKLAGEAAALSSPESLVVRTCGLYDAPSRVCGAKNFANSILGVALRGKELRIVDDQCCTPSFVPDVAEMILRLATTGATGIYHAVNQGQATWYEFGKQLVIDAGLTNQVTPVSSDEYPSPTRRPAYSVLSTERYQRTTNHTPRHWRDALAEYLRHALPELTGQGLEGPSSNQEYDSVPIKSH